MYIMRNEDFEKIKSIVVHYKQDHDERERREEGMKESEYDRFAESQEKARDRTLKHTPGPWKLWEIVNGSGVGNEWNIGGVGIIKGCTPSNARLIAAAPEMLEALKLIGNEDNYFDPQFSPIEIAMEAIRKAKGE